MQIKFMPVKSFLALSVTAVLMACSSSNQSTSRTANQQIQQPSRAYGSSYDKPRSLENFQDYVQFLKNRAAKEGVSRAVLDAQNNINYMPKAVDLDRQVCPFHKGYN